ncbi:hypothetical protein ACOHYD_12630 [Desulfobacterota bacterium M19]
MKNNKFPETNINALLDRIQTEGIDKAEKEAAVIIKAAREKARLILSKARQEAAAVAAESSEELQRRERNLNRRLVQTGRDVVLNVKGEIIALFDRLLQHECRSSLKGKQLAAVISQIISAWQVGDKNPNLEIIINEDDRRNLVDELLSVFRQQLKDGIELKGHPDVAAGFRVALKDSHLYYDFTDEAIAETIGQYLRPELSALLTGPEGA